MLIQNSRVYVSPPQSLDVVLSGKSVPLSEADLFSVPQLRQNPKDLTAKGGGPANVAIDS